jgi:hypothetical protein
LAKLTLFECFAPDLGLGKHNFASHTLKFCLTNTAPNPATDAVLADISQVSLATLGGTHAITISSFTEAAGAAKLVVANVAELASGAVGPFRYIVVYNDTASGKPLIGYYGLTTSQTLAETKTLELRLTVDVPLLTIGG